MKTISIIFNQQKDWNIDLGSDLTAAYFGLTGCVAMHVTERLYIQFFVYVFNYFQLLVVCFYPVMPY